MLALSAMEGILQAREEASSPSLKAGPFGRTREGSLGLAIKRCLDVALSSGLLLLLAPILPMVVLLICLDSPGPFLYVSQRIGKGGRSFACIKFRTMVDGADAFKAYLQPLNERDRVLFKVSDDPRVTRVGRLLRRYSLDELPQLFNVVRGEMSLVGPRPSLAAEVESYAPEHHLRLAVKPGITGLWQIQARQNPSFASYIALDTAYVEHWSLWLDLKILAKTPRVVLGGTGR